MTFPYPLSAEKIKAVLAMLSRAQPTAAQLNAMLVMLASMRPTAAQMTAYLNSFPTLGAKK